MTCASEEKKCESFQQYVGFIFSVWYLVLCSALYGLGLVMWRYFVLWAIDFEAVNPVIHIYLNAVMEQYCYTDWLYLYVQFHVHTQSILHEIFREHHKPLQQLVECALITSQFWLSTDTRIAHGFGTNPPSPHTDPPNASPLVFSVFFPLWSCFQCDVFLHSKPPCGGQRPCNDLLLTRQPSDSGQI